MRRPSTRLAGAVVLCTLLAAGCGRAPAPAAPTPAPAAPAGPVSAAEFEALFRARQDSARMRFTQADVRFMTDMIAHHAQALVMAALVPDRTSSPAIRTLAGRIRNAQQDEIATMQRWLRDRRQPVPEVHGDGTHVMLHGIEHAHMPGMLTAAQLAELERARDAEFDRLFLAFMIQHHRGAVTMVHDLFATDGAAQDEEVFKFASDVQVDQKTEVDRMERMLDALAAGGG